MYTDALYWNYPPMTQYLRLVCYLQSSPLPPFAPFAIAIVQITGKINNNWKKKRRGKWPDNSSPGQLIRTRPKLKKEKRIFQQKKKVTWICVSRHKVAQAVPVINLSCWSNFFTLRNPKRTWTPKTADNMYAVIAGTWQPSLRSKRIRTHQNMKEIY